MNRKIEHYSCIDTFHQKFTIVLPICFDLGIRETGHKRKNPGTGRC